MKALVTGGAGFIGSTLVDQLLAGGHEVVVLDNLSSGNLDNLAGARADHGERLSVVEADIRDQSAAGEIEAAQPEVMFHLAAQADVRVSVADPVLDASINLIGALNVLDAFRRAGGRKVVFASSGGTIYGAPDASALPVDESHPQAPLSPYGVSKKAFTDYLRAYQQLYGLAYTSLALANVYGPRQDPHGEAGVVAIFAGLLLEGRACTVFGSGEQTRDFVFVGDVAAAFALAADRADNELMNIGTGVETSVNELYDAMARAAGSDRPAVRVEARIGELDRSALDPGRAGRLLGWSPAVGLDAGVAATLDWFRSKS